MATSRTWSSVQTEWEKLRSDRGAWSCVSRTTHNYCVKPALVTPFFPGLSEGPDLSEDDDE